MFGIKNNDEKKYEIPSRYIDDLLINCEQRFGHSRRFMKFRKLVS